MSSWGHQVALPFPACGDVGPSPLELSIYFPCLYLGCCGKPESDVEKPVGLPSLPSHPPTLKLLFWLLSFQLTCEWSPRGGRRSALWGQAIWEGSLAPWQGSRPTAGFTLPLCLGAAGWNHAPGCCSVSLGPGPLGRWVLARTEGLLAVAPVGKARVPTAGHVAPSLPPLL